MDCEYEECVLSIVRGGEGWDEEYSSLYEFNHHLNGGILEHERSGVGWVFWRESERQMQQQNQIITLLRHFAPSNWVDYIVQYWRVMEVEEGGKWHHYLSTSHHPFCRYRKLCRGHVYVVDMELGADDQQQPLIGGVGRAYRNKQPESIPDLRLYSTNEFPMRDEATRCGFRGYVALPLFDVLTNQCYGVLEILYRGDEVVYDIPVSLLHEALQIAGLRTTHSFTPHSGYKRPMIPKCDITDMLELAVMTVPLLYFAQVWIPCKQCLNMTTNLCCMKKASSHSSDDATELYIYDYDRACSFHNIQSDARSSHSTFCDLNISKNPLSHYAQRFGMCHYFAISLQSLNNPNHLYVLVFIFRSKIRDDSLHLLSRMMEMHLMKSFKFVPEVQLLKEISVQSRQPNAVECGSIDSLDLIHSYKQELSELNFTAYLETVDSCCLRPSLESRMTRIGGWVFCCPAGETLLENDCNSDPLLVPIMIKEKIKTFMNNIAVKLWIGYWIIQFWAPKLVEDRCYLQTSDQPIAVGRLAKGIASFRKKCLKHYYPVDGEAKEDELGPLGRVFRSGNLEISPHLWCYTRKEFPIRNYALHCCSPEGYFALPIWDDEHNHKCVGVLEFLGFSRYSLEHIERELKEVKLRTTHIDLQPRFLANERPDNTLSYKEAALTELRNTLQLIDRHNIPQLNKADVYVLHGNGIVY